MSTIAAIVVGLFKAGLSVLVGIFTLKEPKKETVVDTSRVKKGDDELAKELGLKTEDSDQ